MISEYLTYSIRHKENKLPTFYIPCFQLAERISFFWKLLDSPLILGLDDQGLDSHKGSQRLVSRG